jgi:hypothetical protein
MDEAPTSPRSARRLRSWPHGFTPARRSIARLSTKVTTARASTICALGRRVPASFTSRLITENQNAPTAMYRRPAEEEVGTGGAVSVPAPASAGVGRMDSRIRDA